MVVQLKIDNHDEAGSAPDRLLDSALKLFAEKGYAGTTVREIIEHAGVTRPVLYYYFKNKEELFCHLVEMHFSRSYAEIDQVVRGEKGCRRRLQALIHNTFMNAENSPDVVRFLLRFFFAPPTQSMRLDSTKLAEERFLRIAEIMRQGIEDGELSGDNPVLLASAFSAMMDMHVMMKASYADAVLTPELGDALVELFMEGGCRVKSFGASFQYGFDLDPSGSEGSS